MATFDYSEIIDDVKELLDEFGFVGKLVQTPVTTTDKSIGRVEFGTPIESDFMLVLLPVTEENLQSMDRKYLPANLVLSDCRLIYCFPADGVEAIPEIGNTWNFGDGVNWKIFSITKIAPILETLLYEIGIIAQ